MVSVVLTWRRRAASCPGGWTAPRGAGRSPAAAFPHAPSPAHTSKSTSQPGQKQPGRKSSSRKVHAVSAEIPLRCEAGDAAPAPRGTPPAHHHFAQNTHNNKPTLHSGSCGAHGLRSCGRLSSLFCAIITFSTRIIILFIFTKKICCKSQSEAQFTHPRRSCK